MSLRSKTAHIWTIGCQMNDDDSDQMARMLRSLGYEIVGDCGEADLVILNTCSVRAKPEHKVRTKLGELRIQKRENPGLIIGVTGCMAQREADLLAKVAPHIDFLLGPREVANLPAVLERAQSSGCREAALDEAVLPARCLPTDGPAQLSARVPIAYGCDNFCAYCVVPYCRGREISRPPTEITDEIKLLAERGTKEVQLLGQNVNSYGKGLDPPVSFAQLLEKVDAVRQIERIRFMTSHPKDFGGDVVRAVADLPKVCEHIHLPLQSGSSEILRKMNRSYTVEHYLDTVDAIRAAIPACALTTDLIVGFPTETDAQYEETLAVVERVRYDAAFMFAYSPRRGTKAAEMPDDVARSEKVRRLHRLIELQNSISVDKNKELTGSTFEVLCEGPSERDPAKQTGLTRTRKTMNFPSRSDLTGRLVQVRAQEPYIWGFMGSLL